MQKQQKKKQCKFYFTQQTQDNIIRYNSLDPVLCYGQRNRIFQNYIYIPLCKICENLIHTYKLYYFQQPSDIITLQAVSFLVLQLGKYNQQKGKAFSYFTKIAFYYLINANNKHYGQYKIMQSFQQYDQSKKNSLLSVIYSNKANYICDYDIIIHQTIKLIQQNTQYLFNKQRDKTIALSIVEILKR